MLISMASFDTFKGALSSAGISFSFSSSVLTHSNLLLPFWRKVYCNCVIVSKSMLCEGVSETQTMSCSVNSIPTCRKVSRESRGRSPFVIIIFIIACDML